MIAIDDLHAASANAPHLQQDTSFKPPFWLRNAHVQSTLPSTQWWRRDVLRRAQALLQCAEPVMLECGDDVRLTGWCSQQASQSDKQPWIVLLHGWLGSADSTYVLSLGALLYARGYNLFRLNLRDHGGSHALNTGIFHSCLLDEVVNAVRAVQVRYDAKPLSIAGFSLGGNFSLRVAAQAPQVGLELQRVVAISPALNPHATDAALAIGLPMYRQYFLANWKQALRLKQQSFPQHYDFASLLHSRSVTELTSKLVMSHSQFRDITEYYNGYALLGTRLQSLRTHAHIVAALDDPIVPAVDLQHLPKTEYLHITTTKHGGHCGFFERLRGERWIDRKVLELL